VYYQYNAYNALLLHTQARLISKLQFKHVRLCVLTDTWKTANITKGDEFTSGLPLANVL